MARIRDEFKEDGLPPDYAWTHYCHTCGVWKPLHSIALVCKECYSAFEADSASRAQAAPNAKCQGDGWSAASKKSEPIPPARCLCGKPHKEAA